jgi:hypothetical protein
MGGVYVREGIGLGDIDFRYYVLGELYVTERLHIASFAALSRSSHLGVHVNAFLRSSHFEVHMYVNVLSRS